MQPKKATVFHSSKFLTEGELLPLSVACPVCGYVGPRKSLVTLQRAPDIALLLCQRCKGCSASRMPTTNSLAEYYGQYYDGEQISHITFDQPERLGRHIADYWDARDPRAHLEILDFGGGDGTISLLVAEHLVRAGFASEVGITVVDYVAEVRRDIPPNITLRFVRELKDIQGKSDVIIASAILEHIPNFRATFDKLLSIAAPKALFYARTPYMSPFARLLPLDLTYPAHVHDIGSATWKWLADTALADVSVLRSGPSMVETVIKQHLLRTAIAHALKTPAELLSKLDLPSWWPYYGGWEVLWRLK